MGQTGPIDLGIPGLEDAVLLGRGGFAVVYRAYQPAFRRTVAVKVVSVTHVDDLTRERFHRECQAMGLLSEHPSIVTVLEAGFLDDGRPFLVMAFMPEGSLQDRLREGPVGWQEATRIGVKLAGALGTAHQAGVLHRDVKPANILVSQYGEPQLADFGIARVAGGRETSSGVITASLAYAPPEIVDGQRPTVVSDVYSLAATLYALMSGAAPFWSEGEGSVAALLNRVMNQDPGDLAESGVPASVAEVLQQAMAKDPQERPASAAQFGRLLRLAQDEQGLRPTQLTVYTPATTPPPAATAEDAEPTELIDDPEAAPTETSRADHVDSMETEPLHAAEAELDMSQDEPISEPLPAASEDADLKQDEPVPEALAAAVGDVDRKPDEPVSEPERPVATDASPVPAATVDLQEEAKAGTKEPPANGARRWLWPVIAVVATLALVVAAMLGGDGKPEEAPAAADPSETTEQQATTDAPGSTTTETEPTPASRVESGFVFPAWWMADPDWASAQIVDHETNSTANFTREPTGEQEWLSARSPVWTPDFVDGQMSFSLEPGEVDALNVAIERKEVWRQPASSTGEFAVVFRLTPGSHYGVNLQHYPTGDDEASFLMIGIFDTGEGELRLNVQRGDISGELEMERPITLEPGRSYDLAIFAEGKGVFRILVWPSGETEVDDIAEVAGARLDLSEAWIVGGGWEPNVVVNPGGSIAIDEYWGFDLPGSTAVADAAPAATANVGLVFDIGGRGDDSFNDSAAAGLDRAVAELGISASEASANQDGSNREELLSLQADQSDLVIGIGFLFAEPMANAAAAHPDVNFGIVDDTSIDLPNVSEWVFAEQEGSFLVGVAAALKSDSGRVGFIGGVNMELIQRFEAGFVAGVHAVDPAIAIERRYLTEPPDFAGFTDPAAAKVVAQSMYQTGADVIYHAAGGSGAGLFQAAREYSESNGSKVWAIGVDSDQYLTAGADVQDYILTSMIKRVDVAVFSAIESQVDGTFAAGETVLDLSRDGVGYATSGGFVDDIVDVLEDYRTRIVEGEIEVPSVP